VIPQLMCDLITISRTIQSRNCLSSGRGLYSIGALVGEYLRTVERKNQIEEIVPGLMVSKCDAIEHRGRTAGGAIAPPAIPFQSQPSEYELQTELVSAGIAGALDHIPIGYVRRRGGCAEARRSHKVTGRARRRELRGIGHVVQVELEFGGHPLADLSRLPYREVPEPQSRAPEHVPGHVADRALGRRNDDRIPRYVATKGSE
jgi:hypothetical protein